MPKKESFVGRDYELSQIRQIFITNTGIVGCVIVGGAGLGKSHLATEYVLRNMKEMYSHVIWMNAEQSDLRIDQVQIYLETCHKVKIPQNNKDKVFNTLYQTLKSSCKRDQMIKNPKKICIIFDKAENMSQIADYLPHQRNFPTLKVDVLVTSCFKKWEKPLNRVIELHAFGAKETENYIQKVPFQL